MKRPPFFEEDLEFLPVYKRSRVDNFDFLPADFIDSFDEIEPDASEPDDVPGPFQQQSESELELEDSEESKAKG